jgi:sterol desaturase/sphingolipid hydroxylase (fatty acid hydroxylase superfamily)
LSYLIASWFDYALHRWLLHHPRGWWMHETHHLPTVVCNGMPGISVRPFVAPTVLLTYLGTSAVLLFGIKLFDQPWLLHWYLVQWPALVLFFTLVGSASHSCFLRRYWSVHTLLRRLWLVTPQEHILHHDARLAGNYGNFASCWDRWLGTYLDPSRHQPRAIGLAYDQDFLGALCRGRWKLSARWRRKFQLGKVCALTTD